VSGESSAARIGLRMILLGVVVLLTAEVAALVAVAQQVGALATVLLLVAGSLAGGWLLRREGGRAWRAFATAVAEGRPPAREVLDGMLVLLGGALVLFPGFVTDVLGLLCLLPPTRRGLGGLLRRYAIRRARARVVRVQARRGPAVPYPPGRQQYPADPPHAPGQPLPPASGRIIDGETDP
jgi:UPF0716 protein FxsA